MEQKYKDMTLKQYLMLEFLKIIYPATGSNMKEACAVMLNKDSYTNKMINLILEENGRTKK